LPENGFVIADSISAPCRHAVTVGFLLHPGLQAIMREGEIGVSKDRVVSLRLRNGGRWRASSVIWEPI
jgi:hypothetical protein